MKSVHSSSKFSRSFFLFQSLPHSVSHFILHSPLFLQRSSITLLLVRSLTLPDWVLNSVWNREEARVGVDERTVVSIRKFTIEWASVKLKLQLFVLRRRRGQQSVTQYRVLISSWQSLDRDEAIPCFFFNSFDLVEAEPTWIMLLTVSQVLLIMLSEWRNKSVVVPC